MKATDPIPPCGPDQDVPAQTPVREPDIKPTPKAEATASNQLPQSEQMKKFEKNLEAHDPGNQPA